MMMASQRDLSRCPGCAPAAVACWLRWKGRATRSLLSHDSPSTCADASRKMPPPTHPLCSLLLPLPSLTQVVVLGCQFPSTSCCCARAGRVGLWGCPVHSSPDVHVAKIAQEPSSNRRPSRLQEGHRVRLTSSPCVFGCSPSSSFSDLGLGSARSSRPWCGASRT
eukprot:COSAG06_NODE_20337_length_799_cov_1.187143_1_plen_164_part_10